MPDNLIALHVRRATAERSGLVVMIGEHQEGYLHLHDNEVKTDAALVRRLLKAQFPQWCDLPIARLSSAGTDHAIYRLGATLAVRLPRIPSATLQVDKEQRWLPQLAPHLPLTIPVPLAKGEPDAGYPWHWSVYGWLDGENATLDRLSDPVKAAVDLAEFIQALQGIDAAGGPLPGDHNFGRGVPLAAREDATRTAIASLHHEIDTRAALVVWDAALSVPTWKQPPVWIHGDLQSGNLLTRGGHLTGVIDFGGLGVGDPACDLQVAWNLFDGAARVAFRRALAVDDATWTRGRGWALSVAVIALPYYRTSNPVLAGISRRTIAAVLTNGVR